MSNPKRSRTRKPLRIGTVENYHHHWYLLIWLVYLTLFVIAEHVVTDNYWVSYLPLDDKIPFCRFFVVPYCLWHPLLFLMTLYLMFYDAEGLKRYMLYIGFGFGGSILFCLLFPNGQDLRPAQFAQNDIFTWAVGHIYAADTNTNVLPSMHVIGCAALTLACFDSEPLRRRHLHLVMLPLGFIISMSTVFIKQHSILDVFAAIPVSAALYFLIYHHEFMQKFAKAPGRARPRAQMRRRAPDAES